MKTTRKPARRQQTSGKAATRPAAGGKTFRLRSLLIPTDFSREAEKGMDCGLALANQSGAQVRLLHVVEFPRIFNADKPAFNAWDRQVFERARAQLADLADNKVEAWIPCQSEVRSGRPYQEICAAARKAKSDLIVLSTHGYSGLKHLLLGSTAERVVRHAPCSVLTVRGRGASRTAWAFQPRRILVPTDFSPQAEKSLQWAVTLARQFQAELLLLHVVASYYPVVDEMVADIAALENQLARTGEKQLARLVKELRSKAVPIRTLLRRGRPGTQITAVAQEQRSDLVVIATHGMSGWKRAFLGSTTEEVVRHAGCPVLVVREAAAARPGFAALAGAGV